MQQLINLLQRLAKESKDRQVIRHSIGLYKRLQDLNPHDKCYVPECNNDSEGSYMGEDYCDGHLCMINETNL